MPTNFHTHTYRCLHALGTEEEYVLEAIEQGVTTLGFSDHAPFPDHDFGLRMSYKELDDYINAVEQSQQKHKDKIEIFKGLEIEYFPKYINYYRELLEKRELDYLALGEHMYITPKGHIHNIFFAESTADYIEYAAAVCEAIETGLFQFIAHPDVMFSNNYDWDENCDRATEMIIDCAEKNDMILEYNANGIRKNLQAFNDGIRYPYPHEKFWQAVSKTNIRVIVGSDCHSPQQVYDEYMRKAEQMSHRLKLNVIENIFDGKKL